MIIELSLGHRRKHPPHSVGLEPQRELQVVRRDGLEIVGAIEPGGGVERSPCPFDQLDMSVLGHILGALEHHVLEQVGESGCALALIPGS